MRGFGRAWHGMPGPFGHNLWPFGRLLATLLHRKHDSSLLTEHGQLTCFLPLPQHASSRLLDPTGRLFSSVVAKDHSTQATAKHLVRRRPPLELIPERSTTAR